MNMEKRIRIINKFTGEVKETDACISGVNALSSVLDYEIESYNTSQLFVDRNIEEDIFFEGHPFFKGMLEKNFRNKLK